MNRLCYRLVFNQTRGMLMVASELASGHAQGTASTGGKRRRFRAVAPFTVPALASIVASLMLPASASAQIIADPAAPATQQPIFITAPNGVPLVNIRTATPAGVSRNSYSQFDVQHEGAILNNATRNTQTQLGGWVLGNPLLDKPARVIVNEVNSNHPSLLTGPVEVAGSNAQVVIANPSGITCNGCGFINATRSTLTTGTPQYADGALTGYRVTQGTVNINGDGMNASGTAYADLIARAVKINAAVWAKNLAVIAGSNQVDAATLASTRIAGSGSGSEPVLSIDVSELGGMYAGKIWLVGTEAVVGVRHAGYIGGTEIRITADGQLDVIGSVYGSNELAISAARINNESTGALQAPMLTLTATDDHALTNRGLIDGQEVLLKSYTIKNLGTGRIYGNHVALDAGIVNNDAESGASPVIAARQRLDIAAEQISNRDGALLFSDGDLAIGRHLDEQRHATGIASSLTNSGATIEASGDIDLAVLNVVNSNARFTTRTKILPEEAIVEASGSGSDKRYRLGSADVRVYDDESLHLHTPEGNYEQWVLYRYQRSVTESVTDHSEPGQIIAGRELRYQGEQLTNDRSRIIAGADITIDAGKVTNIDATGTRTIVDHGIAASYWRHFRKGRDSTGYAETSYAPPPVVQTISLGVTEYRKQAGPAAKGDNKPADLLTEASSANGQLIRTVNLAATLPTNSLFKPAPQARSYLIETDPRFTNYRQWLTSDYLLDQLSHDPQTITKRLGDGYYEQKLVREQIAQLTGRRFLPGYGNEEAQYQALMENAATYAQAFQLVPGIALTAEQMAALTSDLVWLVEKEITLPSDEVTHALVPQVYLRVKPGDLQPDGTLITGERVQMLLAGDLSNSGQIAGRQQLVVNADNIRNVGGTLAGNRVALEAGRDIENVGGSLQAGKSLSLSAARDIRIESTTHTESNAQGSRTHIDRTGSLSVADSDAQIVVAAGNDLTLKGAVIRQGTGASGSESASNGSVTLIAGQDLTLGTVTEAGSERIAWDGSNHRTESSQTQVGSAIAADGSVMLATGRDLTTRGAQVTARDGDITALAGRDVRLGTSESQASVDESHRHTSRGLLSSRTITTRDTLERTTQQGTLLSGNAVNVHAGQDVQVVGSQVVGSTGTTISAERNVDIAAATDTLHETHAIQDKKSGLMGSGGFGVTIGTRKLSSNTDIRSSTPSASTIGATDGHVSISAGNTVTQTGSQLLAPKGDVTIAARKVDIREARATETTISDVEFKQSGLTVAVSNPVVSAVQTAQQMSKAASNTKDGRMKALAAANTAMATANAVAAVNAGQATTINGKDNQIATGKDANGNTTSRDANAADQFGGIQVAISVGTSKSSSHTVTTRDEAAPSTVAAGGNVQISAKGDATSSDVTLRGSQVHADKRVSITADHQVQLHAADNTSTLRSENSSSNASLGVVLSTQGGMGINVAGSRGRGSANGSDISRAHARVSAGEAASVATTGDLSLTGATIEAPQVTADVGGKLVINSLQDISTYQSEQKQIGGSLTIGSAPSANLNFANDSVGSSYRSVNRQSGIRAGDAGFKVRVAGDTQLDGGGITSTQAAVDAGVNLFSTAGKLTTTDIENRALYDAKAASISLGTGFSPQGKFAPLGTGAGLGKDGDIVTSVTRAGISDLAGDKVARTGDKESGIASIFDAERVGKEVNAQAEITQAFSTLAPKAVGDYADQKVRELQNKQTSTSDDATRQALQADIDTWKDGGSKRVALHAVVGGLSGGIPGASGAATSALATPQVARKLAEAELPAPIETALVAVTGTVAGAAVGGAPGAAAALGEVANNFLTHEEARKREQAMQRLIACKDAACKQEAKREIDELNQLDQWRDELVANACRSPSSFACKSWHEALVEAKQSYVKNYAARDDLTGSVANERRQVNNQEYQYRQQISHPAAVGVAKGLMKLTPPAIVMGTGVAAYELTTAIIEVGAIDTAIAVAQGIAEVPSNLKQRLNSPDPTIRGEALVDTLAIAGMSTAVAARIEQVARRTVTNAIERQIAVDIERSLTAESKRNNNIYRDSSIADPTKPVFSPTGPWVPASELSVARANALIDDVATSIEFKKISKNDADQLNAAVVKRNPEYIPPYKPGTNSVVIETNGPTKFLRYYTEAQNSSELQGYWILRSSDIKGLTSEQIASKFSLPQVPTHVAEVTVPTGTKLRATIANDVNIFPDRSLGGNGGGGGVQFEILNPPNVTTFKHWFSNPVRLK